MLSNRGESVSIADPAKWGEDIHFKRRIIEYKKAVTPRWPENNSLKREPLSGIMDEF